MAMKRAILRLAMLLLLLAASSGSFAQEKATEQEKPAEPGKATEQQKPAEQPQKTTEGIDCSAFHKEKYGYLVTKTTRIATPPLDVTVPKGMPIRRGHKAAEIEGKNLADLIAENCPG
jgi:hypothetical protein